MKVSPQNILANHRSYIKILTLYNEELRTKGRVSNLQFFNKVIKPEIPNYTLRSWYYFLKRFKTKEGLSKLETVQPGDAVFLTKDQEFSLEKTMSDIQTATQEAVKTSLNVGADAIKELYNRYKQNPSSLTTAELHKLADFTFKAMKAQDSRIHAIGKMKESNRADMILSRNFDDAAYG